MSELLKPCPFCGGEASEGYAVIWCNPCEFSVSRERWNRRLGSSSQANELDAPCPHGVRGVAWCAICSGAAARLATTQPAAQAVEAVKCAHGPTEVCGLCPLPTREEPGR